MCVHENAAATRDSSVHQAADTRGLITLIITDYDSRLRLGEMVRRNRHYSGCIMMAVAIIGPISFEAAVC